MIEFLRILNIYMNGKYNLLNKLASKSEPEIPTSEEFAYFLTRLAFSKNWELTDNDWELLYEIKGEEYCKTLKEYYNRLDDD